MNYDMQFEYLIESVNIKHHSRLKYFQVNIYLLKFNNRNTTERCVTYLELTIKTLDCWFKLNNRHTRKRCKTCSKLTIKKVERCQELCYSVFIANFEHISHLFSVFLLEQVQVCLNQMHFGY